MTWNKEVSKIELEKINKIILRKAEKRNFLIVRGRTFTSEARVLGQGKMQNGAPKILPNKGKINK